MKVNGSMERDMAMVFMSTKMEKNMLVNGKKIK